MTDLSAFSLEGKTVMVTGANAGIGQGIALSIGRAGGRVIGVGRSAMGDTADQFAAIGAEFIPVMADISASDVAQAMFDAAWEQHGPIDGLVNNAGIIKRADAVDFTEADWDSVMDVNLKAMFFLCQAFGRWALAEKRGGKIVNIASMLSFQGGIRVASYTASKSGVLGITRLLANLAGRSGSLILDFGAHSGGALGGTIRHWRRGGVPAVAGGKLHAWRGHPGGWRLVGEVMTMSEFPLFAQADASEWIELAPGNTRRVLIHLPELMQVEFGFAKGAVGALHKHPHIQVSYVAEGSFEVTIGEQTQVVGQGGSFIVPSNVEHGVVALEAGRLVDVFTPHRADFL